MFTVQFLKLYGSSSYETFADRCVSEQLVQSRM